MSEGTAAAWETGDTRLELQPDFAVDFILFGQGPYMWHFKDIFAN